MKIKYLLILLLQTFTIFSYALSLDSVLTTYKDGVYNTKYIAKTKVSKQITGAVTDDLINEFNHTSSTLFDWALKDLGLQNKGNEVIISFKSSTYDKKTGITHGVFDIEVPYFTAFKDIKVNAMATKTVINGVTKVTANILYSSMLLDHAVSSLYIIPQKNKEVYLYADVTIKFGWFFNIFITKNRYRSIVEWRIKKFTENMKYECEEREKLNQQNVKAIH